MDSILFLKEALKYCSNRPLILVDHGPWYPPALEHLGLRYKQVTFGERNSVESWFNLFKGKTKRFHNKFPFHSTIMSVASYLASFVRMQNILTGKMTSRLLEAVRKLVYENFPSFFPAPSFSSA